LRLVRKVLALAVTAMLAVTPAIRAGERDGDEGFDWSSAFEGRISPRGLAVISVYQPYVLAHARECAAAHAFDAHSAGCLLCRQASAARDGAGEPGPLCPTGTTLLAAADALAPEAARLAEVHDAARREWERELESVRRRCEDLKSEALNCESAYQRDPAARRRADELRAKNGMDAAAYDRILTRHNEALKRLPFNPDEPVGEGPDALTRYDAEVRALDARLRGGELPVASAVPKYVSHLTVLIRARELAAARDAAFADLYFKLIALCDEVDPQQSPTMHHQEEKP